MRYSFFLLVLMFFSFGQQVHAQSPNEPVRLEIELKSDVKPFRVFPLKEKGVILSAVENLETDGFDNLVLRLYDIGLNEKWVKQMPVDKDLRFGGMTSGDKYCFILFYKTGHEKDNNIQLFRVAIADGSWETLGTSTEKIESFEKMATWNEDVIMAFHVENKEYPALIKSNFLNKNIASIWKSDRRDEELVDLAVEKDNVVILSQIRKSRKKRLTLRSFSIMADKLLLQKALHTNLPYDITYAKYLVNPANHEIFITGTFHPDPGKADNDIDAAVVATGVFVGKIHNDSIYSSFTGFSDFDDFYRYFETIEALRLKKKMNRKGDELDAGVGFRLLVNEPHFHQGQLLFTGLTYTEKYRTVSSMGYDFYGRPITIYREVFDGYKYNSALIAAFGKQGDILWNNGYELRDLKMMQLRNLPVYYHIKDETVIAYYHNGHIYSRIIKQSETVDNFAQIPLVLGNSMDRLVGEENASMRHWYDNYFLISGYQKINNNYQLNRNKRNTFFINKIAFE